MPDDSYEATTKKVEKWFKKYVPEMLTYFSIILTATADVSGFQPLKLGGAGFQILGDLLEGKQRKSMNHEITEEIIKELTPFMEGIDAVIDLQLQAKVKELSRINVEFKEVKALEKSDKLSTLSDCYGTFFSQNLTVFEKDNLDNLIGHILEHKCKENYDELSKLYDKFLVSRLSYIIVKLTYINSRENYSKNDKEELAAIEYASLYKHLVTIDDCFSAEACWFFHPTRKLKKDKGIDFVPRPVPKSASPTPSKKKLKIRGKVQPGKAFKLTDEDVRFVSDPIPAIHAKSTTMTLKYNKGRTGNFRVITGPTRMETDQDRTIGTLHEQGFWIGGKLIMSKESGAIKYVVNDEFGENIPESTLHYHSNEWIAVTGNHCSRCCGDIPRKSRRHKIARNH